MCRNTHITYFCLSPILSLIICLKEIVMSVRSIAITPESKAHFINNAAYCIGTGRMGLALQKEYQDEMKYAQSLASFQHIRGHGLFSDDMGIYQPYTD